MSDGAREGVGALDRALNQQELRLIEGGIEQGGRVTVLPDGSVQVVLHPGDPPRSADDVRAVLSAFEQARGSGELARQLADGRALSIVGSELSFAEAPSSGRPAVTDGTAAVEAPAHSAELFAEAQGLAHEGAALREATAKHFADETVRVGAERDIHARRAWATEQEAKAADQQVKRERRIAAEARDATARAEAEAERLEAQGKLDDATEHREYARGKRAQEEAATRRADLAEEEAVRLREAARDHTAQVSQLEAELGKVRALAAQGEDVADAMETRAEHLQAAARHLSEAERLETAAAELEREHGDTEAAADVRRAADHERALAVKSVGQAEAVAIDREAVAGITGAPARTPVTGGATDEAFGSEPIPGGGRPPSSSSASRVPVTEAPGPGTEGASDETPVTEGATDEVPVTEAPGPGTEGASDETPPVPAVDVVTATSSDGEAAQEGGDALGTAAGPPRPDDVREEIGAVRERATDLRSKAAELFSEEERVGRDADIAANLEQERLRELLAVKDRQAELAERAREIESDLDRFAPDRDAVSDRVIELRRVLGEPVPSDELLRPDGAAPAADPVEVETDPGRVAELRAQLAEAEAELIAITNDQPALRAELARVRTQHQDLADDASDAEKRWEWQRDQAQALRDRSEALEADSRAALEEARRLEVRADSLERDLPSIERAWELHLAESGGNTGAAPTQLGEIVVTVGARERAELFALGRREKAADRERQAAEEERSAGQVTDGARARMELAAIKAQQAADLDQRADASHTRSAVLHAEGEEAAELSEKLAADSDRLRADAERHRQAGRAGTAEVLEARASALNDQAVTTRLRANRLQLEAERIGEAGLSDRKRSVALEAEAETLRTEAAELRGLAEFHVTAAAQFRADAVALDERAAGVEAQLESGEPFTLRFDEGEGTAEAFDLAVPAPDAVEADVAEPSGEGAVDHAGDEEARTVGVSTATALGVADVLAGDGDSSGADQVATGLDALVPHDVLDHDSERAVPAGAVLGGGGSPGDGEDPAFAEVGSGDASATIAEVDDHLAADDPVAVAVDDPVEALDGPSAISDDGPFHTDGQFEPEAPGAGDAGGAEPAPEPALDEGAAPMDDGAF